MTCRPPLPLSCSRVTTRPPSTPNPPYLTKLGSYPAIKRDKSSSRRCSPALLPVKPAPIRPRSSPLSLTTKFLSHTASQWSAHTGPVSFFAYALLPALANQCLSTVVGPELGRHPDPARCASPRCRGSAACAESRTVY